MTELSFKKNLHKNQMKMIQFYAENFALIIINNKRFLFLKKT